MNRSKIALDLQKNCLEHLFAGKLKVEMTEFPLENAKEAHQSIEDRKTKGKVVLTVN